MSVTTIPMPTQNVRTIQSRGAFGEETVIQYSPQFQGTFEYTVLNDEINEISTTNGGTVTQASAMGVIGTSTTTGSSSILTSKRHAKYKAGLGGCLRFTALFSAGVVGADQLFGLADEVGSSQPFKNGYMIGCIGDTFGFHIFRNDTITTINLSNWNDPLDGTGASGVTIDTTKLGVWEVQYQYLGAGAIEILFEVPETGILTTVHIVSYSNLNTEPSTHNPNYHFTMYANNNATTSDIVIKSSSYAYFVQGITGLIELHQPNFSSGKITKTSVTSEIAIFTLRNKSTYFSKTNFIDLLLLNILGSVEASSANNLATIRGTKNATIGGSPSYSDINTNNSVVEIDTAGTTVSGGIEIITGQLAGKNDANGQNVRGNKIILAPGETFTLSGSSDNSATLRAIALWRELF